LIPPSSPRSSAFNISFKVSTASMPMFHCEHSVVVRAPAEAVFSYLDDHRRLSAHMSRSSWMMAGSRMSLTLDAAEGRAVGSIIRLSGRVLGLLLAVEERITVRTPPRGKGWETIGTPRLLVIGHYRMGFQITPQSEATALCVFLDYALPTTLPARLFGRLIGHFYARWCVERMARDAAAHFQSIA
jgi:uncharacterized membrane protein